MTIGDRIRAERKAKGMSQELLAQEISRRTGQSFTRAALSLIESGKTNAPSPENLYAVADALALNDRWLLTGAGEKYALQGIAAIVSDSDKLAATEHKVTEAAVQARKSSSDDLLIGQYPVASERHELRSVMVISLDEAAAPEEALTNGACKETVLVPAPAGAKLFATRMRHDSTMNIRAEDILVVSMSKKPRHGSVVLVSIRGTPPLCRVVEFRGDETWLVTHKGTDERLMQPDYKIVGVVASTISQLESYD